MTVVYVCRYISGQHAAQEGVCLQQCAITDLLQDDYGCFFLPLRLEFFYLPRDHFPRIKQVLVTAMNMPAFRLNEFTVFEIDLLVFFEIMHLFPDKPFRCIVAICQPVKARLTNHLSAELAHLDVFGCLAFLTFVGEESHDISLLIHTCIC